MNIDEAKICLSIQVEVKHRLGKDYEATAIQLGLEALTRIQKLRGYSMTQVDTRLPSETEEALND